MDVFCGLFAAVKPATAQTWTQTSAPSNDNWVAVASSADGSKLIAAGMPWIYCISTNSGSTWITNTQPQKGSSYGSWFSIASSADGTKLVGIYFNTIWASTNSGITWFSNSVPGVSAFTSVTLSADGTKLVAVESLQYISRVNLHLNKFGRYFDADHGPYQLLDFRCLVSGWH
jgi:hypothetical protein